MSIVLKQEPTIFFVVIAQHLNPLGAGMVARSKFCTEDAQILGAIVQRLVGQASRRPASLHSWPEEILSLLVLIKGWFLRSKHAFSGTSAYSVICNTF